MGCAASIQPQDNYVFRVADESDKKQNNNSGMKGGDSANLDKKKRIKEKYKADNTVKLQQTGDGGIIITKGKETYILVEKKETGPNGEEVYRFVEERVTSPDGTSNNSYKRDKKD